MRKQLKEVSDLLHWADSAWMGPENKKQFRKDVRAAVRAVREDCIGIIRANCPAAEGETCAECSRNEDAIRGRK